MFVKFCLVVHCYRLLGESNQFLCIVCIFDFPSAFISCWRYVRMLFSSIIFGTTWPNNVDGLLISSLPVLSLMNHFLPCMHRLAPINKIPYT